MTQAVFVVVVLFFFCLCLKQLNDLLKKISQRLHFIDGTKLYWKRLKRNCSCYFFGMSLFYFYRDIIICRHFHISHLHPNIDVFTLLTFSRVSFLRFFPFCWLVLALRSAWPSLPLALASFLTPLYFLSVFPLACSVLETLHARYFLYRSRNLFS